MNIDSSIDYRVTNQDYPQNNIISSNNISQDTITFVVDNIEMLKITPTGFYVRGVKLEQDENESKLIHDALKQFLEYNQLKRLCEGR